VTHLRKMMLEEPRSWSYLYIRFLFVYPNSEQNGEGCQEVGCTAGPVPDDNPNFLLADNPEAEGFRRADS